MCARARRLFNADNSKTPKDTNFKFDVHARSQGQSGHDPLKIFFRKVGLAVVTLPLFLGRYTITLLAILVTDFKFDTQLQITIFCKKNYLAEILHSHERFLVILR